MTSRHCVMTSVKQIRSEEFPLAKRVKRVRSALIQQACGVVYHHCEQVVMSPYSGMRILEHGRTDVNPLLESVIFSHDVQILSSCGEELMLSNETVGWRWGFLIGPIATENLSVIRPHIEQFVRRPDMDKMARLVLHGTAMTVSTNRVEYCFQTNAEKCLPENDNICSK